MTTSLELSILCRCATTFASSSRPKKSSRPTISPRLFRTFSGIFNFIRIIRDRFYLNLGAYESTRRKITDGEGLEKGDVHSLGSAVWA